MRKKFLIIINFIMAFFTVTIYLQKMLTISLFMICRKTCGIFLKPLIPVKDG